MANVKISQLTANAAKIASTDRIAIAKDTGGGTFASRYVTGAEVNEVKLDTTPQLGGNLDVNGYQITSDNDQDVVINPNGVGIVKIESNLHLRDTAGGTAKQINLYEGFSNGSNYIGIKAPDSLSTDTTYTLPTADGTSGQVLSTNGTGTLSWATADGGITVGTTAVTSGIDGRVLMQRTGKVENSIIYENGLGDVIIPTVSSGAIRGLVVGGTTRNSNMALTLYNSLSIKTGGALYLERSDGQNNLALGYSTTGFNLTIIAPASSTGFIYFNKQNGNNIATFDVNLGHFGIGTTSPQARLDVRAADGLSNAAFRVRNSIDSVTLTEIQGTGNLITRHNSSGSSLGLFHRTDTTGFSLTTGTSGYGTGNGIEIVTHTWILSSGARQFAFTTNGGTDGDLWTFQNNGTGAGKRMSLSKSGNETFCWSGENFSIGGNIWGNPPTETNSFGIKNGTAPSTNATDAFKLYSADITAGNAAPHFRTENGAIVKVYQETTAVGASTLVSNAGTNITDTDTFDGYTLKQIVKALRNQGLLA